MIVIYTGNIRRDQIVKEYDIGAVKMSIEPVFLSELDAEEISCRLEEKVREKQRLADEELMEFIILPLSYRKMKDKRKKIQEMIGLVVQVQDREQQVFLLAGLMTFADKIIDERTSKRVRRAIGMTKVAMIFEKEKQEEIAQALARNEEKHEKEKQQIKERYEREKKQIKGKYKKEKQQHEKEKEQMLIWMIGKKLFHRRDHFCHTWLFTG